jgi:Ribbon-helix-helix protein, copG family
MARIQVRASDEMLARLWERAAAEGRSVEELAADALSVAAWEGLVAAKRDAARARGLTASDVARLIEEARRERRGH